MLLRVNRFHREPLRNIECASHLKSLFAFVHFFYGKKITFLVIAFDMGFVANIIGRRNVKWISPLSLYFRCSCFK